MDNKKKINFSNEKKIDFLEGIGGALEFAGVLLFFTGVTKGYETLIGQIDVGSYILGLVVAGSITIIEILINTEVQKKIRKLKREQKREQENNNG